MCLELESLSLTSLDQTDKRFFNPNNAFDAEGLTRLTEQTEARRKREIEVSRAEQAALIASQQAEGSRESDNARIEAEQQVNRSHPSGASSFSAPRDLYGPALCAGRSTASAGSGRARHPALDPRPGGSQQ
jgi:uncharacterized membrane protein YqiK